MHNNLTAYQTFIFYGKLYGINEEIVKKRINELARLLKLPSLSMEIKNLRLILLQSYTNICTEYIFYNKNYCSRIFFESIVMVGLVV